MVGQVLQSWRGARLMWPLAAALAAFTVLVGLGTWQLKRKAWKEGLLADIAMHLAQPPVAIGGRIFAKGGEQVPAYTRVTLSGRFLHDKERYWFADGRLGSGFHVYTPLEVAPGAYVWVNRGYVPQAMRDPTLRRAGQIEGTVTVAGLVRQVGERNAFTPENDVQRNIWFWRDLAALNASAFSQPVKSAPVMVDAEALPANPGGWPEGGTAIVELPNRHLEYALTWYGLAVTLIGVFFVFARGRLKNGV